jgi:hypothetical protein
MFGQWFIFNHRPGMKTPDKATINKIFYISLAVLAVTEFFTATLHFGFDIEEYIGGETIEFGWDFKEGLVFMLLVVFFYLILIRGIRFVTQKSDPHGTDTQFLITKLIQLSIMKDIMYLFYYLISFISAQVETDVAEYNLELEMMYSTLLVIVFILSILYLIPLLKKRIESNYSDYNKLLAASTFASILVYSIVYILDYTVIYELVELPLGG